MATQLYLIEKGQVVLKNRKHTTEVTIRVTTVPEGQHCLTVYDDTITVDVTSDSVAFHLKSYTGTQAGFYLINDSRITKLKAAGVEQLTIRNLDSKRQLLAYFHPKDTSNIGERVTILSWLEEPHVPDTLHGLFI